MAMDLSSKNKFELIRRQMNNGKMISNEYYGAASDMLGVERGSGLTSLLLKRQVDTGDQDLNNGSLKANNQFEKGLLKFNGST